MAKAKSEKPQTSGFELGTDLCDWKTTLKADYVPSITTVSRTMPMNKNASQLDCLFSQDNPEVWWKERKERKSKVFFFFLKQIECEIFFKPLMFFSDSCHNQSLNLLISVQ